MYALHPSSLPPKGVHERTRIWFTADDLARLYKLEPWEYIVWDDPVNEGFDHQDFIHLYPSYYDDYRRPEDKPVWTPTRSTKSSRPASRTQRSKP